MATAQTQRPVVAWRCCAEEKENDEPGAAATMTPRPKVEPLSEGQRRQFEEWLTENAHCSLYPTREEKEKLAACLSVSVDQLTRLFANHRRRVSHKGRKAGGGTTRASSISPPGTSCLAPATPDNGEDRDGVAAICEAIADQMHDAVASTTAAKPISPGIKTKSAAKNSRKRKTPPSVVDENQDPEAKREREASVAGTSAPSLTADEDEPVTRPVSHSERMSPYFCTNDHIQDVFLQDDGAESMLQVPPTPLINSSLLAQANQNVLQTLVAQIVTQPPVPLPHSVMADVNPRLIEAMSLLNKGVSWTHPAILSVLLQIMQQQRLHSAASPPTTHFKSEEEILSELSPDEVLVVDVLAEMAEWA